MELPGCPFVSRGICTDSRPNSVGESPEGFLFYCDACKNFYAVSSNLVKRKARYQNEIDHLKHESGARSALRRRREYSYS